LVGEKNAKKTRFHAASDSSSQSPEAGLFTADHDAAPTSTTRRTRGVSRTAFRRREPLPRPTTSSHTQRFWSPIVCASVRTPKSWDSKVGTSWST
jgi:hypothetical protein